MRRDRGFTLVELLVASSILVLLAGAALAAFSTGVRSAAKVKRQGRMLARGQAALRTIVTDIRLALAYEEVYLTALDVLYEGRHADTVDFIAVRRVRAAGGEGRPGRCEVGYHIDNDPETRAQGLLRRQDDTLDEDPLEGGRVSLVSRFISELNLQFYDGLAWQDEWDDTRRLPDAVRVEIVVVDEDETDTPIRLSTVAAVMAR